MEQATSVKSLTFDSDDSSIHQLAAYALLTKPNESIILRQPPYAYELEPGSLYYKKESYREWVLVANWCLYDAYIKIRYKRAVWLKPFYEALFKRMNFLHISFNKYCIEVLDTNGHFRSSRIFRLSPPGGYEAALAQMYTFAHQSVQTTRDMNNIEFTKSTHKSESQSPVYVAFKNYVEELKGKSPNFKGVEVMTADEIKNHEILMRKLAVKSGDLLLLPDIDSALVWIDTIDVWQSQILAVISRKNSLNNGIPLTCYTKLNLLSSDTQKSICVFLETSDYDDDSDTEHDGNCFNGKDTKMLTPEYEPDKVYIIKPSLSIDQENEKNKRFSRIFQDIIGMMRDP